MREQPPNAWQPWTEEEVEQLVTFAIEGKTPEQIANFFGRSENAVICKLEAVAYQRNRWRRAVADLKNDP